MRYRKTVKGTFLDRPNRFIAHVEINGQTETVHVKNTGRCRELLIPGVSVILEESDNPNRKTKYDLIAVYKENLGLVNIDSQASNAVAKEWLAQQGFDRVIPEYTYGKSRVDFYMEKGERKFLMEVKGCTLEVDGIGYFPDAPTIRGIKHLHELAQACEQGYSCALCYVIAMPSVREVRSNMRTHPQYGEALAEAADQGVKVIFLCCEMTEDSIEAKHGQRYPF